MGIHLLLVYNITHSVHDQYKADENNDTKVKCSVCIKMGNERATATSKIGNIDKDMTSSCLVSSIG